MTKSQRDKLKKERILNDQVEEIMRKMTPDMLKIHRRKPLPYTVQEEIRLLYFTGFDRKALCECFDINLHELKRITKRA